MQNASYRLINNDATDRALVHIGNVYRFSARSGLRRSSLMAQMTEADLEQELARDVMIRLYSVGMALSETKTISVLEIQHFKRRQTQNSSADRLDVLIGHDWSNQPC